MRFKSVFLTLLVFLLSFFPSSNLLSQTNSEPIRIPDDIKNILDKGEIVVAMTRDDMTPFYFRDQSGNLSGLDIKLAKGIADKLGVGVVFNREAKSFNDVVDLVAKGKADIAISKLSRTLARAKMIRYSDPYIVFRQGLLVNRLGLAKKTQKLSEYAFIKKFTGKLGVIQDSSYVGYAMENFPKAEIVEFKTWRDVVDAVFKGDILAAYRDEMEIKKIARGREDALVRLKTIIITDQEDPIAMAVAWNKTHLLSWLNLYLKTINLELNSEKLLDMYPEIFVESEDER